MYLNISCVNISKSPLGSVVKHALNKSQVAYGSYSCVTEPGILAPVAKRTGMDESWRGMISLKYVVLLCIHAHIYIYVCVPIRRHRRRLNYLLLPPLPLLPNCLLCDNIPQYIHIYICNLWGCSQITSAACLLFFAKILFSRPFTRYTATL